MQWFSEEHFPTTKFLFFTGKGGVGKTSVASSMSLVLAKKGQKVLLISTDPASNLQDVFGQTLCNEPSLIQGTSHLYALNLDPVQAAADYKERIIAPYKGRMPDAVLATMEEQMSGACTVEIAAFNQFSTLLTDKRIADEFDVIVFDTAPTGHTLLLLDASEAYHKEISRSPGEIPESVRNLLPKLRDGAYTSIIITTLPETTPVLEAKRLEEDLLRAGIAIHWWVINQSFYITNTVDPVLVKKAQEELTWIENVKDLSDGQFAIIPWSIEEPKGMEGLHQLREPLHLN